jgi:hypothetical protein
MYQTRKNQLSQGTMNGMAVGWMYVTIHIYIFKNQYFYTELRNAHQNKKW